MVAACPIREVTRWSDKSAARTKTVTLAALHESVGGTDAASVAKFCEQRGVSYHAIADNDKLVYTVPRSRTAWHLRGGNPRADGLCLATPVAGYTRAEWLGAQLNKVKVAGWWLALVCADRGIDLEQCTLQNVRDALGGSRAAGGVTTHNDYTIATRDGTHTDPRNFPVDVALTYARSYAAGTAPSAPSSPTAPGSPSKPPTTTAPAEDDMTPEQDRMLREVHQQLFGPWQSWADTRRAHTLVDLTRQVEAAETRGLEFSTHHGATNDNQFGHTLSIRKEVVALRAQVDSLAYLVRQLAGQTPPPSSPPSTPPASR